MRENAFCMVLDFSWRLVVRKIHLTWKAIQNARLEPGPDFFYAQVNFWAWVQSNKMHILPLPLGGFRPSNAGKRCYVQVRLGTVNDWVVLSRNKQNREEEELYLDDISRPIFDMISLFHRPRLFWEHLECHNDTSSLKI